MSVAFRLRTAEQMDDPRRRDRNEQEPRQVMGADEDRIDMQRQRQRQHGVHCARREGDDDIGETDIGGQQDHRDEDRGDDDCDRKRTEAGIDVPEQRRFPDARKGSVCDRRDGGLSK